MKITQTLGLLGAMEEQGSRRAVSLSWLTGLERLVFMLGFLWTGAEFYWHIPAAVRTLQLQSQTPGAQILVGSIFSSAQVA